MPAYWYCLCQVALIPTPPQQTSKRTTRKPQTLAQTTYAMQHPPQPPSSPFTSAPLHHRSNHVPYPQPGGPPGQYPGYPYGYAPPGYPQYASPSLPPFYQQTGDHPTLASKAPAASASAAPAALSTANAPRAAGGKDGSDKTESHDANAWEAAQHILEAINFSALHRIEDAEQPDAPFLEATLTLASNAGPPTGPNSAPRTTLTEDERAALQAQLALLAAQLTEIANASDEEEEEEDASQALQVLGQPVEADVQMQMRHDEPVSNHSVVDPGGGTGTAAALDGGPPLVDLSSEETGRAMAMLLEDLDSAALAMAQEAEDDDEEESDEDEDMEMVEVPTYVESDALRT